MSPLQLRTLAVARRERERLLQARESMLALLHSQDRDGSAPQVRSRASWPRRLPPPHPPSHAHTLFQCWQVATSSPLILEKRVSSSPSSRARHSSVGRTRNGAWQSSSARLPQIANPHRFIFERGTLESPGSTSSMQSSALSRPPDKLPCSPPVPLDQRISQASGRGHRLWSSNWVVASTDTELE